MKKSRKPKTGKLRKKPQSPQVTQDYIHFIKTARKLDLSPSLLCKAIGYSMNTHHGWKKVGQMPAVAQLACECLLRRRKRIDERSHDDLYAVTIPRQHVAALESFCKSLGGNATYITLKENVL